MSKTVVLTVFDRVSDPMYAIERAFADLRTSLLSRVAETLLTQYRSRYDPTLNKQLGVLAMPHMIFPTTAWQPFTGYIFKYGPFNNRPERARPTAQRRQRTARRITRLNRK